MTTGLAEDSVEIVVASTSAHFEQVEELFAELMAWDSAHTAELGFSAALVQQFYYHQGVVHLPGEYAPPSGQLLLATHSGNAAGCGAYINLSAGICELKRLYVRKQYRGRKLGQRIVTTLLDSARRADYHLMRLETVCFMQSAIAMYRELGFRERSAYYEIPEVFEEITLFMELELNVNAAG
jgi:putative acetyltransferase